MLGSAPTLFKIYSYLGAIAHPKKQVHAYKELTIAFYDVVRLSGIRTGHLKAGKNIYLCGADAHFWL